MFTFPFHQSHGWLENLRTDLRCYDLENHHINGPLSSTPCLIIGGYLKWNPTATSINPVGPGVPGKPLGIFVARPEKHSLG